jgi:hypothetical protein
MTVALLYLMPLAAIAVIAIGVRWIVMAGRGGGVVRRRLAGTVVVVAGVALTVVTLGLLGAASMGGRPGRDRSWLGGGPSGGRDRGHGDDDGGAGDDDARAGVVDGGGVDRGGSTPARDAARGGAAPGEGGAASGAVAAQAAPSASAPPSPPRDDAAIEGGGDRGLADKTDFADPAAIRQLNKELMPLIHECIDQAQARDPRLDGMLVVAVELARTDDGRGIVAAVTPRPGNQIADPELLECIRQSSFALEGVRAPHDFDLSLPIKPS